MQKLADIMLEAGVYLAAALYYAVLWWFSKN